MKGVRVIIPVVGAAEALVRHHVRSIRESNPRAEIHLLMDDPPGEVSGWVDCVEGMSGHLGTYEKFLKEKEGEFVGGCGGPGISFMRHFAPLDYAEFLGMPNYWVFDWDILVVRNLEEVQEVGKDFKGIRGGGNFFVADLKYTRDYLESWAQHWLSKQKKEANSDQFIELHMRREPVWKGFLDAVEVLPDGSVFDHNLCTMDTGFVVMGKGAVDQNMKLLVFKREEGKAVPYGFHRKKKVWVRFNTLHCWGVHREMMGEYLDLMLGEGGFGCV